MCTIGDLLWDQCDLNMGGMRVIAYYGEVEDVLTWPAPTATPTVLGDKVTYLGPFVMKSTKQMYELYSTMDTAEVVDEAVGEIDGKSFETTYELFHPGTKAAALELAMTINNGNFFFVPVEADGQMRIVGSAAFPAKVDSSTIRTAKDAKGRKGWMLKVRARNAGPAPIYDEQTIPLTPAA